MLVNHGDLIGVQVRNAGGHQVHDGLDLFLFEPAAGLQLHEYGGTAVALVADEGGLTRYRQMHTRAVHGPQARDGVRQFGLHGVLVAGVLNELTDTQSGILGHQ